MLHIRRLEFDTIEIWSSTTRILVNPASIWCSHENKKLRENQHPRFINLSTKRMTAVLYTSLNPFSFNVKIARMLAKEVPFIVPLEMAHTIRTYIDDVQIYELTKNDSSIVTIGDFTVAMLAWEKDAAEVLLSYENTRIWLAFRPCLNTKNTRAIREWPIGDILITSIQMFTVPNVLAGRMRGFPIDEYHDRLEWLLDISKAHKISIALIGDGKIEGRSAWLNNFLMPVTSEEMASHLINLGVKANALKYKNIYQWLPESRSLKTIDNLDCEMQHPKYDPTAGLPPFVGIGILKDDLLRELVQRIEFIMADKRHAAIKIALVRWDINILLSILGKDTQARIYVSFKSNMISLVKETSMTANMRIQITAQALSDLLNCISDPGELLISDELRYSERIFQVDGSTVYGPKEASTGRDGITEGASSVTPVPDVMELLRLLTLAVPIN